MLNNIQATKTLNDGVKMPGYGLGVYKVWEDDEASQSVQTAIQHGYRLIDTASFYDNEVGVGQGIKESGVNRDDLFITTKVWNDEQGYDHTLRAFEASMNRLELDYLDLYLVHWPVKNYYRDTWKAMERLVDEGLIRSIGVSNFKQRHLEDLMTTANVKPTVNQVEYHPHLQQHDVKAFCEQESIQLEAWSPLKRGDLFDDETIQQVAQKHGKTPAQVILRWDVDTNVITIPKSVKEHRIVENSDIFDFQLDKADLDAIKALNRDERVGPNPDQFG
ncbi:aldo/keto reductase [Alkalibacillus salilacus]|uniref:Diketogulonate reductase-like aldo/keto reductase n=1 Tax=Alkalibacillus salilacus TaxID=284582 RepID=A0ABT9VH37_9BACI|nr:aldo/keto reductase [Alkalibacillus salilacus]MDQ0160266.1 diketogulonate reductase-like aldo/keto reductase [Alkalibacillus salilacus]